MKDLQKYKIISNKVRSLTRKDHHHYLDAITARIHTDQKPFWRWIQSIRGNRPPIPDIHYHGSVCSNAIDKAEALNQYFTSVFTQENITGLEALQNSISLSKNTASIEELCFSDKEVFDVLRRINPMKSCGPDNIPGRLLVEGAPAIAKPLATFFNLSLQTASLPEDWLKSNVIPIFKKGSKHSPSNYRPISLTSLVGKILERLILNRINIFLDRQKILHPSQHGFRQGHSCQTQLLASVHLWAESLDRGSSTHIILIFPRLLIQFLIRNYLSSWNISV